MEVFYPTLNQMLVMFILILIGFMMKVTKTVSDGAYIAVSRLETYVFLPAMIIYNLMNYCTIESFVQNSNLILYGLILTLVGLAIAYPVSSLFVRNVRGNPQRAYLRNIYRYALTFGNFGFMGNYITLSVWGEEAFFLYTMFTLFTCIIAYGWGTYILVPKEKNAGMMKNLATGLLKPPMIATVIGIILGLCNIKAYVPPFVNTVLSNSSNCMGPLAMILAGMVIGSYPIAGLLKNKQVYVMTFLRLFVIPAAMVTVLKLLHTDQWIITMTLIAFATPLGLNTVVYPAAFGGDTKPGASMAMISHTLSVVTIPAMYYLFVVLWK